ncbi:Small glutamine-rich tetratricopeptide repeat-containing protein 2 [Dispira parvispora]|uniref:Small glutamine-rich tetratricopeptide repeat-containing protein 2 n=1 Tax=Dispira parvispora TaxID=1520584 RepID=A0A9W8E724_9FUNG|nr:Small glutamine-rich tetratricopeptide repeat-containing protein 2 [Dispira parvispora]
MDNSQRKLAFSILEFLQQSVATGQIPASSTEGIEIAVDCIGEAFGVDINDDQQRSELSISPATLPQVFDVYLKTQEKMAKKTSATSADAPSGEPSTSADAGISNQDQTRANELKAAGNQALAAKEYDEAIRLYGEAISLDARNPIYFANRAAAYSQRGDYSEAVDDANRALEIDPKYSKAYSRLAHAYFGLKQYDLAVKAYDKGLELDPSNANMKSAREVAQQRLADSEATSSDQVADAGSSARGGPGGMDFSSLLNNPGLMNMASQMMSNGGLANLMNNPAMRQMAEGMMGGGQGGSGGNSSDPLASLMGNPQLQQMAQQFMGGASGRNNASSDSSSGGNPLGELANNPQLRQMAEQFMRNQGGSNGDS